MNNINEIIIDNYLILRKFFLKLLKNYTLIIAIISLIGCSAQCLHLILISPKLVVYYSLKQGITDGLLFLIFASIAIIVNIFIVIFLINVSEKKNVYSKTIILLTNLLLFVLVFYAISNNLSSWLLLLVVQLTICPLLLIDTFKKKTEKTTELINDKYSDKPLEILLILMLIQHFFAYSFIKFDLEQENLEKNYNLEIVQKQISNKDFKLIYSNLDYMIFYDSSKDHFLILKTEDSLKIENFK